MLGLGLEGLDTGGYLGGLAAPLFLFEDGGLVFLETLLVAGVGLGDRVAQGFDLLALVGGGLFKGGEGSLLLFEGALSLGEDADLALGEGDAMAGVSAFGGEAFALFLEDLDLFFGFVVLFSGLEEAFADLFVLLDLLFEDAGLFFVSGGALESEACGAGAFGGALVTFEPELVEAFGEAFFLGEGGADAKGLEGIIFGGGEGDGSCEMAEKADAANAASALNGACFCACLFEDLCAVAFDQGLSSAACGAFAVALQHTTHAFSNGGDDLFRERRGEECGFSGDMDIFFALDAVDQSRADDFS